MVLKEEKSLIGIDSSNKSLVIGSVIIVLVAVPTDFFRKFTWLNIKDGRLLDRKQITQIVEGTQKYVGDFMVEYIKPKDIDNENLDIETNATISLLNKKHKFWKHKISINNFEKSKEDFIARFTRLTPENLKAKLNMEKWTITPNCSEKRRICALASCYAKYYSMLEHDEIKSVWGDFGSGEMSDPKTIQFLKEQADCPHISQKLKEV